MQSELWRLRAQQVDLPLSFLKLAAVFLHAAILVGLILSLLFFNLICESVCLEPVIIFMHQCLKYLEVLRMRHIYTLSTQMSPTLLMLLLTR